MCCCKSFGKLHGGQLEVIILPHLDQNSVINLSFFYIASVLHSTCNLASTSVMSADARRIKGGPSMKKQKSKTEVSAPKQKAKQSAKIKSPPAAKPSPTDDDHAESEGMEEEGSGSDGEENDEEAMQKLMELLGEDGFDDLDDLDEGSAHDSEEVEDEENSEDGGEADSDGSEDEEELVALDDLEDGHIDEDVVPQQKVEIDNTACVHPLIKRHTMLILSITGCSSSHKRDISA